METTIEPTQTYLSWFDIWRLSLFHPTKDTFQRMSRDPKAGLGRGLLWTGITTLLAWFGSPLTAIVDGWVTDNFGLQVGSYFFIFIGPLAAVFAALAGLLISAACSHGLARLFEGAGTFHQLVYCWGVMTFPYILVICLAYRLPMMLLRLTGWSMLTTANIVVSIITLVLVAGLYLYLFYAEVMAFSSMERIGWGKGFGILALESVIMVVAGKLLSSGLTALLLRGMGYYFR